MLNSSHSDLQRVSAGEFTRRSIKERADLLSSLFPGSNKPPSLSSLSDSKVLCSTTHDMNPPPFFSSCFIIFPVSL